jgi:hypothetical protein
VIERGTLGEPSTSTFDLVGRWDIISWVQQYDDGRLQYPMGADLIGFIRYTSDGDVIVQISRSDRPQFTTGGQWDADKAEQAAAYGSMLTYSGRYVLDGDHVTHHVDISLYPGWVGTLQRRRLAIGDDGTIALEARLEPDTPEARTARLLWRPHVPERSAR